MPHVNVARETEENDSLLIRDLNGKLDRMRDTVAEREEDLRQYP